MWLCRIGIIFLSSVRVNSSSTTRVPGSFENAGHSSSSGLSSSFVSHDPPWILHIFGSVLSFTARAVLGSQEYSWEAEDLDFSLDGILTKRPRSIRLFTIYLNTNESPPQTLPVIFDTGSPYTWLISQELATSLAPDKVGYDLDSTAPTIGASTTHIGYLTTGTTCKEWRYEQLQFLNRQWSGSVCIADATSVTLTAVSGIVGANLNSDLVREFKVFWLIPQQQHPDVGLILGDRIQTEQACHGGRIFRLPIPLLTKTWRITAAVRIGDSQSHLVQARIDTGGNRVYLSMELWRRFVEALDSKGIRLMKNMRSGEYYSEPCALRDLPIIHLRFGEFNFDLIPEMYVISTEEPVLYTYQVHDYPSIDESIILVGAPVLTRVVTKWDSNFPPSIGFCRPL